MPKLRNVSTLCPKLRHRGGGRRERSLYANGATTVLVLGPVLNTVGLGLFCGLIFALAVYAVPFFVAGSIGMLTFHSGAGVIGALLIGIAVGALTLGALVAPCRVYRTWKRYSGGRNMYRGYAYAELLALDMAALRRRMNLQERTAN